MRVSIVFQGRVQGVGFRATARSVVLGHPATSRPLTGWVRNEADGSVRMELQGDTEAVEGALAELADQMCHRITSTQRSTIAEIAGERRFEIVG